MIPPDSATARSTVQPRAEDGSIALVMLVAIIVMGVMGALVATVVQQQRSVRFDQSYTAAAHVTDAGIQEAYFRLRNNLITPTSTCNGVANTACGTGVADGQPYRWTATRINDTRWRIESTGTANGQVARTLTAVISEGRLFTVAGYSELGVSFTGGNTTSSYNSVDFTTCSLDVGRNADCNGIVATNGDINLSGNNTLDRVHLYNYGARPDGPGITRCTASGNSIYACAAPTRTNIDRAFDVNSAISGVQDLIAQCTTWHSWTASSLPGTTVTFPYDAGTYCFDNLTIDRNTVLRPGVTPANPIRIVMRAAGRMEVASGISFNLENCPGRPATPLRPCSPRITVFSLAADSAVEAVRILNQAKIAAGVYAPYASCGVLSGSNAQVQIYGSLMCSSIRNQGGWGFHYDEALGLVAGDGRFAVERLDEQRSPPQP